MMKISRSDCPNWLIENKEEWTRRWIRKVDNPNKKNNWDWYNVEEIPTNQKLLQLLLADTKNHCSYCDKRPIRVEEIDHFKPKVDYPKDAFDWNNLFVVCKDCNFLKLNDFSDLILKPDELEYEYDKYFSYNEIDGLLEAKGEENSVENTRAKETIEKLKLNEKGLPEARKIMSAGIEAFQNMSIDSLPFRFIFIQ